VGDESVNTLAVVVGVGARTSLGLTARHTAFLLRAGMAGFHEAPLLDANDEPIAIGSVPTLDPVSVGADRVRSLAEAALADVMESLSGPASSLRVKIVLGLAQSLGVRTGKEPALAEQIGWALHARLDKRVAEVAVETLPKGEAAAGMKLGECCELLAKREVDVVLLGGAHSDYDPVIIRPLSEKGLLFGSENINGVLPGESAAFVALATPSLAHLHELPVHARLLAVGTGFEKARPDNDESAFEALGLTLAVRAAAAPLEAEKARAGWLLSDMTAEAHRVQEWSAMFVRTQRFWCEPQWIDTPAHKLGRLGASALPLHVALAATAWRHGFAPHPFAMSMVGSDAGERVATLWSQGEDQRRMGSDQLPGSPDARLASGSH
jgi:3-oxoacyl-[acyl-carrier-protein] synthase-1